MIYRTFRIAKIGVDEEGFTINEEFNKDIDLQDSLSICRFKLDDVVYWEEYKGSGNNGVKFFTDYENKQLTWVDVCGASSKIIITVDIETFTKDMDAFHSGEMSQEAFAIHELASIIKNK